MFLTCFLSVIYAFECWCFLFFGEVESFILLSFSESMLSCFFMMYCYDLETEKPPSILFMEQRPFMSSNHSLSHVICLSNYHLGFSQCQSLRSSC